MRRVLYFGPVILFSCIFPFRATSQDSYRTNAPGAERIMPEAKAAVNEYLFCTTISLRSLASLAPDDKGGIKCVLPAGQTGNIILTVRQFDPQSKNNLGGMLYSVSLNESSDTYKGKAVNYTIGDETKPFSSYLQEQLLKQAQWPGDDYKHAVLASAYYTKAEHGEALRKIYDYPCPVIVQLSVTNATVSSVKIPGLRTPIPFSSFNTVPYLPLLEAIKFPLSYPNYIPVAAHNGYWKDVPENSYPSYDYTTAGGADMVQIDVRYTKDAELIAFGDACIDRLTTGTGRLNDHTWPQLQQLQLKDRFGFPTGLRMLKLSDAFVYLKGRTMINLDIEEGIYKDPATGLMTDMFTPALEGVLKSAQQNGVLSQLIIKGKLPVNNILGLLDKMNISLNDFMYTPIAYGWKTEKLPSYIKNWLDEPVPAIEMMYQAAYDPVLQYAPLTINKNKRIGTFSFWPNDENGVIAEDNINQPPSADCRFNYRQYDFLNEDKYGVSLMATAPNFPSYIGSAPYGGGSYNVVSPLKSVKATEPGLLNNGRGNWDWLFGQGANYVITDHPVMMMRYLEARGKRKLEVPAITEVELPECVTISNGRGTTATYNSVQAAVRKINDYSQVEFFTPDTREIAIDTNLVMDRFKEYANGKTREWVRNFIKTNNRPCTCKDLFADNPNIYKIRQFPNRSLSDWTVLYPGYDVYFNCNFFDVSDPVNRKPIPQAPYKLPCTDVIGFWQSSNGTVLTKVETPQPDHGDTDAFILDAKNGEIIMVKNKDVPAYEDGKSSKFAISGYILVQNGVQIPYDQLSPESSKTGHHKRTFIGYNGKQLYIAAFLSPLLQTYQVGDLMVKYFNCTNVFMVDGGGSTTLLSSTGDFPAINVQVPLGPGISSGSAAEDRNLSGVEQYRPIPNFLAIRPKQP